MWAAAAVAGMSTARRAVVELVRERGEPVHWSDIGHSLGGPPGPWAAYGSGYARYADGSGYFTVEGLRAGVLAALEAGELVQVEPQMFAVPLEAMPAVGSTR